MSLRATARLQFHKDFTLSHAVDLVPYLSKLGISHVYASPLLKSRPGSTHGYDIVDHHAIDPELGGEPALRTLVSTLRAADMGLILDIVPNHMGVGGADNAWWLDVLEWGRASPYAEYFDIDWEPPDAALRGKMLAPFLGTSYGDALLAGDITLHFDPEDGRFFASAYGAHRFPIAPRDYPIILAEGGPALAEAAQPFAALAAAGGRRARAEEARRMLRETAASQGDAIVAALAAFSPASPEGRDRLDRLLERQNYRLAWWRAAADEINWRRFFDINGLAGVRAEQPQVFDDTHEYVLRLYAEGLIDGVRIDHVDGLADPRGYCRKLRRRLDAAAASRPAPLRVEQGVIWIEKILAPHEHLPTDWLTDGTTGYDFMNEVAGLLHDPAGEAPLTELWSTLTGRPAAFEDEARPARRQILRESLFSELYATAAAIHRIARRDPTTRDYTLTAVRRALEDLLVHFPVYRIYSGLGGISETDRRVLDWAMAGARRTVRPADAPLLELIGAWLAGEGIRDVPAGPRRNERLRAMVRFQQLSAPTAAKSVEDTAFYRYGRLLSRNEVGSEPSQFALTPAAFHASNRERRRHFPRALLATATHDHKRGEDTRARIAVLSEIPDEWEQALARWIRLNNALKRTVDDAAAPDAADEIMLYQMLVGAWPLDLAPDDRRGSDAYKERLWGWWEKALREGKRHSEWAAPNAEYEGACRAFLDALFEADRPSRMLHDLAGFAQRIATPGALNALSQTLLRLTCPGVPDLYQGAEFWDFSLVDPDNRRPVDYPARIAALGEGAAPPALMPTWRDGRVKQAVIARALAFRARATALFASGTYAPLPIEGRLSEQVFAFARIHEGRAAIVVASRLSGRLCRADEMPIVPTEAWQGTALNIPRNLQGRNWTDVLGGPGATAVAERLPVAACLAQLPVALLEAQ
jgi:(1->4)-alpha-D-glucan 1-alpha-D-glucosylmutase